MSKSHDYVEGKVAADTLLCPLGMGGLQRCMGGHRPCVAAQVARSTSSQRAEHEKEDVW